MGVGPIAGGPGGGSAPSVRDVPELVPFSEGPPPMDRKAALLEKERRFREAEERQQEAEAREEQALRAKRAKPFKGISRLGPVQPREEDIPQFLPAPMQVPPPRTEKKMEIKISQETAERAKGPEAAPEIPPDEEEESEDEGAEDQVLAFLRMEKAQKNIKAKAAHPDEKARPKKKRKRTRGRDGEGDDPMGEEDYMDDDDQEWEQHQPQVVRQRDGGVSKSLMVIDSVKGKVSTANRNFTDADLERRFSMPENQGGHGSLMTEAEVLRMIQKEKQEKGPGNTGNASRRVQRELAEWAHAKEQQRARVKSPHRFERMVVSRK